MYVERTSNPIDIYILGIYRQVFHNVTEYQNPYMGDF